MDEKTTGGPVPPSGREANLIEQARRQVEGLTPGDEALATLPGMPPPDTFPGYEVIREIHHGGQGAVYLAIQKTTRRKVAVKVMHGGPHIGSSGRARFEREVQILGQLNHPNIVRILDSGATPDGGFFYVMDYISGRTLDEHIAAVKPGMPEVLKLFVKICEGVNAAHLKGVIHRDIKPANVRVDSRGEPVIVDFGLAKIAVPDATAESRPQLMSMTGQFIGSLPWASPEQAEGNPAAIDVRTDVYSVGVMLYQMLTGRFPYEVVGNMRDVLDNILRVAPARPSTIRRQINAEVETIVLKCLTKERERRYQNAGEVSRDLTHYLNGEPIEAKRDSGWYVISKTLRRYRPQVAVVCGFVVLLAGWGGTGWIQWSREHKWRTEAEATGRALKEETDQKQKALTEASEKREALERELKRKELMLGFVEDVFDAATPEVAQGREIAVVEAVDAAARMVEAELGGDDELSGEMHHAIGQVYQRLAEPDKAEPHLKKAEELLKERIGAARPETLEVMSDLALAYRMMQNYPPAESRLRAVVAGYSSLPDFGPEHTCTLEAKINLARTLGVQRDQQKTDEAAEIYKSLIAPLRAAGGQTTNLIAVLTSCADHLDETDAKAALPLITDALKLVNEYPDPARGRLDTKTRLVYAQVHDKLGANPVETERVYRRVIDEYARLMGESNRDTLNVRSQYAMFLRNQGRFEEAVTEWGDLVGEITSVVDAEDPVISQWQGRYGESLLLAGRLDEAEPILLTSLEGYKRRPPGKGFHLVNTWLNDLYTKKNMPEKAKEYPRDN